jgi:hypothetical protein
MRPLLATAPAGQPAADVHEPDRWHARLSLASHDLFDRPDLREEIWSYTAGLAIPVPPRFTAEIDATAP